MFKDKDGRKLNVPEEIGINTTFGILLLVDSSGARVKAFKRQHGLEALEINTAILSEWISGGGIQPVTWATLSDVLADAGLTTLSDTIREAFGGSGEDLHNKLKVLVCVGVCACMCVCVGGVWVRECVHAYVWVWGGDVGVGVCACICVCVWGGGVGVGVCACIPYRMLFADASLFYTVGRVLRALSRNWILPHNIDKCLFGRFCVLRRTKRLAPLLRRTPLAKCGHCPV